MHIISRVADHCFWFGRYLERAESTARVLAVTQSLALDAELPPLQCWLPVLIVAGERATFESKYGEGAVGDGEMVQWYMTWDEDNFASIRQSVAYARENARSIREVVSLEAWEAINELYLWLGSDAAQTAFRQERFDVYKKVRQLTQLCLGLLRSTMLHDTPLDFIWLGVMLERVGQTGRLLDVHHHAFSTLAPVEASSARAAGQVVIETALWVSLLRACSGFEPFMKRFQARVTGQVVASFLILEPQFPRSVRYCVHSAYERLTAIRPTQRTDLPGGEPLQRLRVLDTWVAALVPASLDPLTVHETLTHVVDETAAICEGIGRSFFGHGPPPSKAPKAL